MTKTKKLCSIIFSTILFAAICWAQPANEEAPDSADIKFVQELQTVINEEGLDKAIELFHNNPKIIEKNIDLKLLLGDLYYSDSQFDNSIKIAQEVLAKDSNNIHAMELLSQCYKRTKDFHKYQAITDKILSINPNNPTVNIQKADEQVLRKKWKLAKLFYSKALQGDSENLEAMFGFAKMSYYLDDLKTAVTYLNKILDADPYNAEALAYMGTIEFDKENFKEASNYVEKALSIEPHNYNYWIDYGKYMRYQGKFDKAIVAWENAIKIDPTYFLAYENLAGIYDEREETEKALENYRKVIETNPKYFYAYETTAILEYHAGNYENAIKYFSQAYEYNDSYSYSLMIAACYFKLKKPLEAKKILVAQMKKLNNKSTEYDLVRFFHDPYNRNAEQNLLRKIKAEDNSNTRGKMLFYMGLYNEINGSDVLAKEFYSQVSNLQAPMFFEYRIAVWGLEK